MSEKIQLTKLELAALILTAAFICWPFVLAPAYCVTDAVKNVGTVSIYQKEWQRMISGTHVTDWLLVFVGFGQVVLIGVQARIYYRQVDISIATQQPNIFVRKVSVRPFNEGDIAPIRGDKWFAYQPVWKNTGQISPLYLEVGASYQVRPDEDLPVEFDYSVARRRATPIGRDMEYEADPIFINEAKMKQVLGGERNLFIWGEGEYIDPLATNVIRRVEFCYRTIQRGTYTAFIPHGPYNRSYDRSRDDAYHSA